MEEQAPRDPTLTTPIAFEIDLFQPVDALSIHRYGRILSSPAHCLSPRIHGPPVRFRDILGRIGTPAKTHDHLFHRAFPSSIAPYNGCPKGHALSPFHFSILSSIQPKLVVRLQPYFNTILPAPKTHSAPPAF